VADSDAGTTRRAISVTLQLLRKTSSTRAASTAPIMMASRTDAAEVVTSWL